MIVTISPSTISGTVSAPSSKSYAQRAIAIAMLANGYSTINGIDKGGDVEAVLAVAESICGDVKLVDRKAIINGGNFDPAQTEIFIGESGLATRLLTPIASLFNYSMTITGHGSILTRPISMMQKPLEELGVKFESNGGYLPIEVCGAMCGGEIEVDGSLSSQFISGLLISLPLCGTDSIIRVKELKSKPYIDMTINIMKLAGVDVINEDYKTFKIKGKQYYNPLKYTVEGDWSGASCLLVAGAVAGEITINGLSPKTDQADAAILQALDYAGAKMSLNFDSVTVSRGNLEGFSFDATHCPDLFPALAILAANCKGRSTIVGTSRLTHKESDRAATIKTLLESLGIEVDLSYDDAMVITGGNIKGGVTVDSFNDHRIAMAAAVAALTSTAPITIERAEAVNKSYSNFWNDLSQLQNLQ